jgi:hypothetical protein
MITNYKEYLNKIDDFKNKQELIIEELKNKLQEDLEKLFSEYFKIINVKDIHKIYTHFNNNVILVDDDYGFFIKIEYLESVNNVYASFYTTYKKEGYWIKASNKKYVAFNPKSEDIESFVKNYVDSVTKRNIIRKKDKETREFNKAVNQYNL